MDKLKKYLPHIGAVVLFLGLALGYMHPLLNGKALFQSDIVQFKGMSKELADYREKTGEEALWTNSMFCGMPGYQISVYYPNNLAQQIHRFILPKIPSPANYLFLMMVGAYFMFIMMGVGWRYALVGAFGYAFASYTLIILETGHNSKAHAMVWMTPVIGAILMTYRGRILLGSALLALFLSLEIAANHLQVTYYLMMTVLILGLVRLVDAIIKKTLPDFLKATGMMVVAALIAVGPNVSALWTTADYGAETMRGQSDLSTKQESSGLDKDYALSYSYGIGETFTLLIPDFKGGSSHGSLDEKSHVFEALMDKGVPKSQAVGLISSIPTYWGDQVYVAGPVYLGAIICFLAMLGFIVLEGRNKWWLIGGFLLSISLAWGSNFEVLSDFFFYHVPGYNKFRAVSIMLVIAQLILPISAVLGLKKFLESEDKEAMKKYLLIATGVVGGLCLLFAAVPSMFFDFSTANDAKLVSAGYPEWLVDALVEDRQSLLQGDAMRSFGFIVAAAILLFAANLGKLKGQIAAVLIAVLVLGDLWSVDHRYLDEDDFISARKNENIITPSAVDQQILADTDPNFRVINLTARLDQDSRTSYFHKSLGGYHGAKLKRYQELVDSCISRSNLAVLNMLNAKYFITPDKEGNPNLRRNPLALGNAWFVQEVSMVDNADQELAYLNRNDFNPARVAVIDKRFENELKGFQPTEDSTAGIYFMEYEPNYLKYETEAATDQLAVFSEIYFANGWNAYVDGELKPHWRANYVLRSMIVPAGKHVVEFKFEPKVYYTGEKISLAGSILLALFVIGGVVVDARSKKD